MPYMVQMLMGFYNVLPPPPPHGLTHPLLEKRRGFATAIII